MYTRGRHIFVKLLFLGFNRPDLDIAERNLAVISLQSDIAAIRFGKQRHSAEFAFCYSVFEIIAAQDVFEILDAIYYVFALFRRNQ